MDDATWGALALTLTLLGAGWTWLALRRRGPAAGLRAAAWTLLPAAAWLTGTLEMFSEIAGSVADWATHLVLSPLVWIGLVLAGLSVVLFGVSGAMLARGIGTRGATPPGDSELPGSEKPRAVPGPSAAPVDDEMAEIEALLRKRGIT